MSMPLNLEDLAAFVPSLGRLPPPSATAPLNHEEVRRWLTTSYPVAYLNDKGERLRAAFKQDELIFVRDLYGERPGEWLSSMVAVIGDPTTGDLGAEDAVRVHALAAHEAVYLLRYKKGEAWASLVEDQKNMLMNQLLATCTAEDSRALAAARVVGDMAWGTAPQLQARLFGGMPGQGSELVMWLTTAQAFAQAMAMEGGDQGFMQQRATVALQLAEAMLALVNHSRLTGHNLEQQAIHVFRAAFKAMDIDHVPGDLKPRYDAIGNQVAALLATPSALVLEIASAAVESWMSPAMYTVHPPLVSTALSVFITQPHTNMVVSRAMISSSCRLIATFCERVTYMSTHLLETIWQGADTFLSRLGVHIDPTLHGAFKLCERYNMEGYVSITQLRHSEWDGIAAEAASILRCLGKHDTPRIVTHIAKNPTLPVEYKLAFLACALEQGSLVQEKLKNKVLTMAYNAECIKEARVPTFYLIAAMMRDEPGMVALFPPPHGITEPRKDRQHRESIQRVMFDWTVAAFETLPTAGEDKPAQVADTLLQAALSVVKETLCSPVRFSVVRDTNRQPPFLARVLEYMLAGSRQADILAAFMSDVAREVDDRLFKCLVDLLYHTLSKKLSPPPFTTANTSKGLAIVLGLAIELVGRKDMELEKLKSFHHLILASNSLLQWPTSAPGNILANGEMAELVLLRCLPLFSMLVLKIGSTDHHVKIVSQLVSLLDSLTRASTPFNRGIGEVIICLGHLLHQGVQCDPGTVAEGLIPVAERLLTGKDAPTPTAFGEFGKPLRCLVHVIETLQVDGWEPKRSHAFLELNRVCMLDHPHTMPTQAQGAAVAPARLARAANGEQPTATDVNSMFGSGTWGEEEGTPMEF